METEPMFSIESAPSVMQHFIAAAPRVGVALAFVLIGASKFDDHSSWVALFQKLGGGNWFRYLTGAMQISGGLLGLIPRTAVAGLGLIACTMAGATVVDLFVLRLGPVALVPFILLVTCLGCAWQVWMARH